MQPLASSYIDREVTERICTKHLRLNVSTRGTLSRLGTFAYSLNKRGSCSERGRSAMDFSKFNFGDNPLQLRYGDKWVEYFMLWELLGDSAVYNGQTKWKNCMARRWLEGEEGVLGGNDLLIFLCRGWRRSRMSGLLATEGCDKVVCFWLGALSWLGGLQGWSSEADSWERVYWTTIPSTRRIGRFDVCTA